MIDLRERRTNAVDSRDAKLLALEPFEYRFAQ